MVRKIFFLLIIPYLIPIVSAQLSGEVQLALSLNRPVDMKIEDGKLLNTFNLSNGIDLGDIEIFFEDLHVTNLTQFDIVQGADPLTGQVGRVEISIEGQNYTIKNLSYEIKSKTDAALCIPVSESKTQCAFVHELYVLNEKKGNLNYKVVFESDFDLNSGNVSLIFKDEEIGQAHFNFSNASATTKILDDIAEKYSGSVTYSGNSLYEGQLHIEDSAGNSLGNFPIVKGTYEIQIKALQNSTVKFFVDNILVHQEVLDNDKEVNSLDLQIPINPGGSFPDEDKDGVPDSNDKCPNSQSSIVNQDGCGCEDIPCPNAKCLVENLEPVCVETCDDGVKNQDEEGIDCGGTCPDCTFDKFDCHFEDCNEGFTCQPSGQCTQNVSQFGLICKKNNYDIKKNNENCLANGHSWIEEDIKKYVTFDVSGFPIISSIIEDEVEEKVEEARLCLDTVNLGCSRFNLVCPGQYLLDFGLVSLEAKIKKEIDKEIELGWFLDIFVDINYEIHLDDFQIEVPGNCPDAVINQNNLCAQLNQWDIQGVINVLFILDGLDTEEERTQKLLELRQNTRISNDQMNVLFLFTDAIDYAPDPNNPSGGNQPSVEDILSASNNCPGVDAAILLSNSNDFNPSCAGVNPICSIPIGNNQDPAEILLRLFLAGIKPDDFDLSTLTLLKQNPNVLEVLIDIKSGLATCESVDISTETIPELTRIIIEGGCWTNTS